MMFSIGVVGRDVEGEGGESSGGDGVDSGGVIGTELDSRGLVEDEEEGKS